jgi:hypothetical protein
MHLMLTNKGPTPLPIGTGQEGGYEGLLPPGLEIPFALDEITTLVFGEQPDAASRDKYRALEDTEVDPDSDLAIRYAANIDQWKGRDDPLAETCEMVVSLYVRNVGYNDVTITTTEGPVTIGHNEGVLIVTMSGTVTEGEPGAGEPDPGPGPGPGPDPDDPFDTDVTSFTAELDPVLTLADASNVDNGDTISLTATGGETEAMAAIDGKSGGVYEKSGNTVKLAGLDLSSVVVAGLTATAHVTPVPDTSGTINAFSAANPTEVAMDAEDEGLLLIGDTITLEALTGDPAAMAAINGLTVAVLSKTPVTLELDLSAVDVAALTADFTVN